VHHEAVAQYLAFRWYVSSKRISKLHDLRKYMGSIAPALFEII
jgi:hypothetical protein